MRRIEICGGVATGKTTLATLLERVHAKPVLQGLDANPFLSNFYVNPARYALETEVVFLLQHYANLKALTTLRTWVVCDTSFTSNLAYASINLPDHELGFFTNLACALRSKFPAPEIVIKLHCSQHQQMRRIKARGRDFEQDITYDYLEKINGSIERLALAESHGSKLISIDTETINYQSEIESQNALATSIGQVMASFDS
jgi:deoxyadenosine/deoxycytidine kinase